MVISEQPLVAMFSTADPATGASQPADFLPAADLYIDGVLDAAVVTVALVAGSRYKADVTLPELTVGQSVHIFAAATVGGVAADGKIFQDIAGVSASATEIAIALRSKLRCW